MDEYDVAVIGGGAAGRQEVDGYGGSPALPHLHGYEVRDQPIAVLGGIADTVQHAQLVIHGLMPQLHRLRTRLVTGRTRPSRS
ncbi:hypothetical protein [Nonomuraea sp. KM90]|uniref:hypothetical protein n=1 Tax=Nonomuraea sp. KM90 TaxID=3457428 RepID=UPI003FCD025D